jgi:hypothetical protein
MMEALAETSHGRLRYLTMRRTQLMQYTGLTSHLRDGFDTQMSARDIKE